MQIVQTKHLPQNNPHEQHLNHDHAKHSHLGQERQKHQHKHQPHNHQNHKHDNHHHKGHHHHGKSIWFPNVLISFIVVSLCFFIFIYEYMVRMNPPYKTVVIIIQSIFYFLMIWSLFMVYITHPGQVPPHWQLYQNIGLSQRRYCVACHLFKPERSHHCSICQRCILNMDHHCPWVSNCIGLRNRKYFILFIFYMIINLIFVSIFQIPLIIGNTTQIIQNKQQSDIHFVLRLLVLLVDLFVLCVMVFFISYHINMILINTTTIQELDKKRIEENKKNFNNSSYNNQNNSVNHNIPKLSIPNRNNYDIGKYQNFCQVFGNSALSWLIPITPNLKIDGINWSISVQNETQ